MPLKYLKSPKAFSQNVKTEMEHGKPQKQAVAIAYNVQREAKHKKMAHGGMVEDCPLCRERPPEENQHEAGEMSDNALAGYADGGSVDPETLGHKIGYPGYDDGGEVQPADGVNVGSTASSSDDAAKKIWQGFMATKAEGGMVGPLKEGNWAANEKEPKKLWEGGYNEGGQVEDDDELRGMLGSELMHALEGKEHKRIMDSIEAIVLSCVNRRDHE